MAHSKQAKKRVRQTIKSAEENRAKRTRMRSTVKAAEAAIEAGDKKSIAGTFQVAMSELHKAAQRGLIKKNAAARKISRLAARIKQAS